MAQPRFPLRTHRTLLLRRQAFSGMLLLNLGQDFAELFFEPGMQDRIGDRLDSFRPQVTSRWAKEGEQFGGASTLIFVWVQSRMPFWLPGTARLGDGLIGSGLVLIELDNPCGLSLRARQLDQSFFSGVWES